MKRSVLLSCFFLYAFCVSAQEQLVDTAFQNIAAKHARHLSLSANASHARLYNGTDFANPRQTSFEEHPYYISNDWLTGAVHYDGILFEDVALTYDIHSDRLITLIPVNGREIKLITEKIDYFVVNSITFVKLSPQNLDRGFYGRLYNGDTKVYVRYTKSKQERIENRRLVIEFPQSTRYYVLKNGKYFSVRSKKDVLKVLGDRKAELKQFAQKENLRFKATKAESLVKLASFYDSITE